MMPRKLLLALGLVALLASAVQGIVDDSICEGFSQEECPQHDQCVRCRFYKLPVCMERSIAVKLSKKLFACDFGGPPPPAEPEPAPPAPAPANTDCDGLADEGSCAAQAGCVWCLAAAVPSACYSEEQAKRLPAAVFQCQFRGSYA